MLCWFSDRTQLRPGAKYAIKHTSKWARALVKDLHYRLDVNTLHRDEHADSLSLNEIGRVTLRTTQPLFFDEYRRNRATGSFILVDEATNDTLAGGMILGPAKFCRDCGQPALELGARSCENGSVVHEVAEAGSTIRPTTKRLGRRIRRSGGVVRRAARARAGRRICDLAAGTGKLTRLLTPTGADLIAVEPVAGMRAEFREGGRRPAHRRHRRGAPFADGALDAVLVAQAWHWFDHDRAGVEMRRSCAPAACSGSSGTPATAACRGSTRSGRSWTGSRSRHRGVTTRTGARQRARLPGSARCTGRVPARADPLSREHVVQRIASVSHVAVLPSASGPASSTRCEPCWPRRPHAATTSSRFPTASTASRTVPHERAGTPPRPPHRAAAARHDVRPRGRRAARRTDPAAAARLVRERRPQLVPEFEPLARTST